MKIKEENFMHVIFEYLLFPPSWVRLIAPILEKITNRIDFWLFKNLSIAGRLQLVS